MPSIYNHVANSTNELDLFLEIIESAISEAVLIVETELQASHIDIFFIAAPELTIPEYGIGGYTPGPNHCYIYLDPSSENVTKGGLFETLLHEVHHCMRWREQGYGTTLGEAVVSEGLACMYEEMHRGSPPIYATQKLPDVAVQEAIVEIYNHEYDHDKWFYGTGDVPRWFGYSYGFTLCKQYAEQNRLDAISMISIASEKVLNFDILTS